VLHNVGEAVSLERTGPLVEPEWIGKRNYMGERGIRRRGQYTTSADVLIAYDDSDGHRHGLLVESKYTETYPRARVSDGVREAPIELRFIGRSSSGWTGLLAPVNVLRLRI
jgi:hypothetical protein